MNNIIGLIVSFAYISILIGIASYGFSKKKLTFGESRKFVHIGAANWWLLAWLFFNDRLIATAVPAIFLIFNLLNYKYNFVPGLEDKKRSNGLGTIWYTIAILILTYIFFASPDNTTYMSIGALSVLILGYGDGLAGLIGEYFGKTRIEVKGKSVEGTLIMFIMSFLVAAVTLPVVVATNNVLFYAFFIALLATTVELFSPWKLDNILIPLIVAGGTYSLIYYEWFYAVAIAFSVSAVASYISLLTKKLTPSAAILSLMLGTVVYFFGGPYLFGALVLYYVSGALLETYHNKPNKEKQKNTMAVIENGFAVLLFAILFYVYPVEPALTAAFVAVAGATSDAWGSGLGYFSKEKVRELFTWKVLPKGESGGVTKLGLWGSLFGAMFIALFSLFVPGDYLLIRFLIITIFGFATSLLDSAFGLLFQAKYLNTETNEVVEKRPRSMKNYKKIHGYTAVTNGMVNLLSITLVAILACLFAFIVF